MGHPARAPLARGAPLQIIAQSPQALLPAVGHQERLWGTTMQAITGQPIQEKFFFFEFFRIPDQPLAKQPEHRSRYKTAT